VLPIFAQFVNDLSDDLGRYLKAFQRLTQPVGQGLFSKTRKVALATIPGAAIIGVLLFLHVAGEHAAIVGTAHQSTEGNLPFRVPRPVMTGQYFLFPLEGLRIYEELIRAVAGFPCPLK
jgi:hypothetical protein